MPPKRRVKGGVRLSKILNKGAEDALQGTNLRFKKLMYNRSDGTYRVLYEDAEGNERSTEKIKSTQLKGVSGLTEVRPREYEFQAYKGDEALRDLFSKYIGESEAAASAPPPAAAAAAAEAPEPEPAPAPAPAPIKVRRIVRRKETEEESEEEERAAKARVRIARPAASATVASTASPAVPRELLPAVSGPAPGSRAVREKVASAPVREKMAEIATERVQRASAETVGEEAIASAITESHAPPPVFERRDIHAKKERKEMDAADELADIAEEEEVPEETVEEYERSLTEYDIYGYRVMEPDLPDEPSVPSAAESHARKRSAKTSDMADGAVVVDRFGRPEPPGEASSSGLARRLASGSSAIGFRREEITEQDRAESRVRIIASILDLTEQGDLSVAHRLEIATRFGRPINASELRELGRQILVARQDKLRRLAAKGFRTMSRAQMKKALSKL